MNSEVKRQQTPAAGRYSIIRRAFGLGGRDSVKKGGGRNDALPPKPITAEEYLHKVQRWLSRVIEAAAEHNQFTSNPGATNPALKSAIGVAFQVQENYKALVKARGH